MPNQAPNQIMTVTASPAASVSGHNITVGQYTIDLMSRQTKLQPQTKQNVQNEAIEILSHCKLPGDSGIVTNLAMGYVQSGKTLSFTTVSTLAMDNDVRIIVYFAGSKTNLLNQTIDRLKTDLDVQSNRKIQVQTTVKTDTVYENRIINLLKGGYILLFPILKHAKYIGDLATLFGMTSLQQVIANMPVLVIDDEADQCSLNTCAFQNAKKGNNDSSATYGAILDLRKALPVHSYLQYTATPQAAFLIDTHDIMSPDYFTVLTPGGDYTGGDYFFNDKTRSYVINIPDAECYHYKNNVLHAMPPTLAQSVMQFFVSVAQVVRIEKRVPFLSMMVHVDGTNGTNDKFALWISTLTNNWMNAMAGGASNPAYNVFVNRYVSPAYNEMKKYVQNPASLQDILDELYDVMLLAYTRTVQQGDDDKIDWTQSEAHILVGAEKLNRGFTIENLSMTYMPRTPKGKSNADTVEQRCRFFGYKRGYSDVIRLFLSKKCEQELRDYCVHEEALRNSLLACPSRTVKEFRQRNNGQNLIISRTLNPTRTNILSDKMVRENMCGWSQMRSLDAFYQQNMARTQAFLNNPAIQWTDVLYGTDATDHRVASVPIDDFISYFEQMHYYDIHNNTRKALTIRYLEYLRDDKQVSHIFIYEMAYKMTSGRKRSLDANGNIQNLFQGYAASGRYPGDAKIMNSSYFCIQFHHLCIQDPSVTWGNKQMYNLAIYYPTQYATSFAGL